MKRSALRAVAALVIVGVMSCGVHAQIPATWDGGDGAWQSANWNGGQTAAAVFGDDRMSNGAFDVTIGGGSQVTYFISETEPTLNGFRPRSNEGPTSLTFKEGALWHHNTPADGDADGEWTTWDADLHLDNGTVRRTFTPGGDAQAGGILMFGSWRSVQDQQIDITLTNGGKIENDGQIWFGADEEHAVGLKVSMIINDGSLDLTGGAFPTSNDTNLVSADWAMFIGRQLLEGDGTAGDGSPKGEEYEVNFRGPGTITVDHSGIWVYRQDEFGAWTATQSTYEQLWDDGLLKSKGMSGANASGQLFENFFTVTGMSGTDNYTVTRKNPTVVNWDGGDGMWDAANWNGGQTDLATMGTHKGSDGGEAVVVAGAGVEVTYDPNLYGDFQWKVDQGISSLTIKDGASVSMNSASDVDGKWTRMGADLTLDNGTLRRTKDNVNSLNGGAFILGGFSAKPGQEIDFNLTNGGRFENDGQVWFGPAGGDDHFGLEVTVTIDNGTLDLTGGDSGVPLTMLVEPDILFYYGRDSLGELLNEKYAINFTGSGSITVDHSGIAVATVDAGGVFSFDDKTYQDLWDLGILQANGMSGLDGATFGDFFTTSGMLGMDNYMLNSLLGGIAGDHDGDGDVDGNDFLLIQRGLGGTHDAGDLADWKANFGQTGSVAAASAVPEPAGLALACLAMGAALVARRRVR